MIPKTHHRIPIQLGHLKDVDTTGLSLPVSGIKVLPYLPA